MDGKDQFICEFRFDGDGIAWVQENWIDVAQQLGLTGSMGVSYQVGGSVVVMTVSGTLINQVKVASVTLDHTTIVLTSEGATAQLSATISPENATNKNIFFVSSDPSIASVSASGLVTAVANGSAIITVTTADGAKSASCTVTVSIPEPTTPPPTESTSPSDPTVSEPEITSPAETNTTTAPVTDPSEPISTQPPTEPTDPTDEVNPTDPTLPCEPSEPEETEKPTEMSNPTQTDVPSSDITSSEVPSDAIDAPNETQNVSEADKAPVPIYYLKHNIGIACLAGLILLLTLLRRKKNP